MRMQAIWNGAVVADSDHTIQVEGNHYFPEDAVNWDHFTVKNRVAFWHGVRVAPVTEERLVRQ